MFRPLMDEHMPEITIELPNLARDRPCKKSSISKVLCFGIDKNLSRRCVMPLDPQDRPSLRLSNSGRRSRSALAWDWGSASWPDARTQSSPHQYASRNSPQNAIVLRSLRKTPISNSGNLTRFSTARALASNPLVGVHGRDAFRRP